MAARSARVSAGGARSLSGSSNRARFEFVYVVRKLAVRLGCYVDAGNSTDLELRVRRGEENEGRFHLTLLAFKSRS